MAELIMMLFGILCWVGRRNHISGGVQIPTLEGTILRVKGADPGHAWTYLAVDRLKVTPQGQHWYSVDPNWSVLDWMHIGITWQIWLNRPFAAAMLLTS